MRSLVNRGFTPRRIGEIETRVRAIARDALAALDGKPDFDIVAEFFMPLPVTVIAELLGVEPERSADFKRWSDCAVAAATGGAGEIGPVKVLEGFSELTDYLIEHRRAAPRQQPRDDLISTLIRAEEGETALTPVEVVMFTLLLLVAGNETTTNLLGNTLLALFAAPRRARARAPRPEPDPRAGRGGAALRRADPVPLPRGRRRTSSSRA